LAAQGRDVILSTRSFAASRAFANKIWNAARFRDDEPSTTRRNRRQASKSRSWGSPSDGFSRASMDAIREVTPRSEYEFNLAAKLYQFHLA